MDEEKVSLSKEYKTLDDAHRNLLNDETILDPKEEAKKAIDLEELIKIKSDETRYIASRYYWKGKYDGFWNGLLYGFIMCFCSVALILILG